MGTTSGEFGWLLVGGGGVSEGGSGQPQTAWCLAQVDTEKAPHTNTHCSIVHLLLCKAHTVPRHHHHHTPTPPPPQRYQPRHNIMVSSEFGTPDEFFKGFNPALANTEYGR